MGLFGKKKEPAAEAKPKSVVDKIVMGAIIGTAIGSVVGLSMAPKSGKETREFLKEQYEAHKDLEEVKKLTKETVSGFGSLVKNLIFGKSKTIARKASERAATQRSEVGIVSLPEGKAHSTGVPCVGGDASPYQPTDTNRNQRALREIPMEEGEKEMSNKLDK